MQLFNALNLLYGLKSYPIRAAKVNLHDTPPPSPKKRKKSTATVKTIPNDVRTEIRENCPQTQAVRTKQQKKQQIRKMHLPQFERGNAPEVGGVRNCLPACLPL